MYVSDINAYHKIITILMMREARGIVLANGIGLLQKNSQTIILLTENDSVLDIGTGTGTAAFQAAIYAGLLGRVVGVDRSQGMIEEASK